MTPPLKSSQLAVVDPAPTPRTPHPGQWWGRGEGRQGRVTPSEVESAGCGGPGPAPRTPHPGQWWGEGGGQTGEGDPPLKSSQLAVVDPARPHGHPIQVGGGGGGQGRVTPSEVESAGCGGPRPGPTDTLSR